MIKKYLYGAWLLLTLISGVMIFAVRYLRGSRKALTMNEVIEMALAIFGGISGGYLLYQSWSLHSELVKLIENEGIVAMAIGGLVSLWFGIRKISELAMKR